MDKPISRELHGIADYTYATLFAVAPELVGYADDATAMNQD